LADKVKIDVRVAIGRVRVGKPREKKKYFK